MPSDYSAPPLKPLACKEVSPVAPKRGGSRKRTHSLHSCSGRARCEKGDAARVFSDQLRAVSLPVESHCA